MYILRIEHTVNDYNSWKNTFDRDPAGREKSGVKQYRILRPVDDDKCVIIDLEFDTKSKAELMLTSLQNLWGRVQDKLIFNPSTRIMEIAEKKEYLNI